MKRYYTENAGQMLLCTEKIDKVLMSQFPKIWSSLTCRFSVSLLLYYHTAPRPHCLTAALPHCSYASLSHRSMTGSPHYCLLAAPLPHCPIAPLSGYFTVSRLQCPTALLHHCLDALLPRCLTAPLYQCLTTRLPH
jgi:hypothetical protein